MRKPKPYSQLKGGVGKSPLTMKGQVKSSPAKALPALLPLLANAGVTFGLGNLLLPHAGVFSSKGRNWMVQSGKGLFDAVTVPAYNHRDFGSAFRAANEDLGPGEVFRWNGKTYKTTRQDEYPDAATRDFWENKVFDWDMVKDNPEIVEKMKELWIDAGMPIITDEETLLGGKTNKDRPMVDLPQTAMSKDGTTVIYAPGGAHDFIVELVHLKSGLNRDMDPDHEEIQSGKYTQMEDYFTTTTLPAIKNMDLGVGDLLKPFTSKGRDQLTKRFNEELAPFYDKESTSEEMHHFNDFARDKDGNYIVGNSNFIGWSEEELDEQGNPALWIYNEDGEKTKQRFFFSAGEWKGTEVKNEDRIRKAYFAKINYSKDYKDLTGEEREIIDTLANDPNVPTPTNFHEIKHEDGSVSTFRDLNLNLTGEGDDWFMMTMPYIVGENGEIGGSDSYHLAYLGIDPLYTAKEGFNFKDFDALYTAKNGYAPGNRLNTLQMGSQERLDYYKSRGWNPDVTVADVPFYADGTPNPNYNKSMTEAQKNYKENIASKTNPLDNFDLYGSGTTTRAEAYNNPGISGMKTRRGIFNTPLDRSKLVYNETTKEKEEVGKLLDISISPDDYHLFSDIGTYKDQWGDILSSAKDLIMNDQIYDGQTNERVEWGEGQKEEYLQKINNVIDGI